MYSIPIKMTKLVYLFDGITGLFEGEYHVPESPMEPGKYLMPTFCTEKKAPPDLPEKTRHFTGEEWEYRAVPLLAEPGKKPTPAQMRRAEIMGELWRIDSESARPARAIAIAIATGEEPPTDDVDMLVLLESRAEGLRADLAALSE